MSGGVAVRANLLCVTWSAAQGHVFLFDIEARERVSAWSMPTGSTGYSDAAGVAMDENFHLYVADPHNQRVRHFSVFGRHLGDFGRPLPATGDIARDRTGVLEHPRAVAVLGRTLVVAGGERPRRFAVQRFDRGGNALTPLYSGGDPEAEFAAPHAVYADDAGILVADTLAGCVQRFRSDGAFVASVPCAPRGQLTRPVAVVRRADGSLLLVDRGDEHGLRAIGADGRALPLAEELAARCRDAVALAVDEAARLYVLDHHGERVVRFDPELVFDDVLVDLAEHLDDYEPGRFDS